MFVKPIPGGTVRDPHTKQIIPAEGVKVNDTDPYWIQRVAHGDVTVVHKAQD